MKRQLEAQRIMQQSQLKLGSLYNEGDTNLAPQHLHSHDTREFYSTTPELGYGIALPWENNKRANPFRSRTPELQRVSSTQRMPAPEQKRNTQDIQRQRVPQIKSVRSPKRSRTPELARNKSAEGTIVRSSSPTSLRGIIQFVNESMDHTTPTLKTGSYALNAILRKVKDKLENLYVFNRALEDKYQKLFEIEEGLTKNYENLLQREADLEEREMLQRDREEQSMRVSPSFECKASIREQERVKSQQIEQEIRQLEEMQYELRVKEEELYQRENQLMQIEITQANYNHQQYYQAGQRQSYQASIEISRSIVEQCIFKALDFICEKDLQRCDHIKKNNQLATDKLNTHLNKMDEMSAELERREKQVQAQTRIIKNMELDQLMDSKFGNQSKGQYQYELKLSQRENATNAKLKKLNAESQELQNRESSVKEAHQDIQQREEQVKFMETEIATKHEEHNRNTQALEAEMKKRAVDLAAQIKAIESRDSALSAKEQTIQLFSQKLDTREKELEKEIITREKELGKQMSSREKELEKQIAAHLKELEQQRKVSADSESQKLSLAVIQQLENKKNQITEAYRQMLERAENVKGLEEKAVKSQQTLAAEKIKFEAYKKETERQLKVQKEMLDQCEREIRTTPTKREKRVQQSSPSKPLEQTLKDDEKSYVRLKSPSKTPEPVLPRSDSPEISLFSAYDEETETVKKMPQPKLLDDFSQLEAIMSAKLADILSELK